MKSLNEKSSEKSSFTKRELFQIEGIQVLLLLLGILLTYVVLTIAYKEDALVQFFKGISLQNLIDIIIEANFTELLVIIYFIVLFLILYVLKKFLNSSKVIHNLNPKQESIILGGFNYFREGSFTLPVIVMIGFPMLLQLILPTLIYLVAVFELLIPFVIVGELYFISKENFKKIIKNRKEFRSKPLTFVSNLAGVILAFPLVIYFLIISGLDHFFNLVHYNILWENPDSQIAQNLWSILNRIFALISFNINPIMLFFDEIKYFLISLIVLGLISTIYLFLKQFIKVHAIRQVENFILKYD